MKRFKEFTLTDVDCCQFSCSKCGKPEWIPKLVVDHTPQFAPKNWVMVAQEDKRTFFCPECSLQIGIGVHV